MSVVYLVNDLKYHYYDIISSLTGHQNNSNDVFGLVELSIKFNAKIKWLSTAKYSCWSIL